MVMSFIGRNRTKITMARLNEVARENGLTFPQLYAAYMKESATHQGFIPNGELNKLYERHYLHNLTKGKFSTTNPDVSSPIPYSKYGSYADQTARLLKAISLAGEEIGLRCASYGMFQIMGANYKPAGYTSAARMVDDYLNGEEAQLASYLRFIKTHLNGRIYDALRSNNFAVYATLYNGSAHKGYDVAMAKLAQDATVKYPEYCIPEIVTDNGGSDEDIDQKKAAIPQPILVEAPTVKPLSKSREIALGTTTTIIGGGTVVEQLTSLTSTATDVKTTIDSAPVKSNILKYAGIGLGVLILVIGLVQVAIRVQAHYRGQR